jgi:hypothetical protein
MSYVPTSQIIILMLVALGYCLWSLRFINKYNTPVALVAFLVVVGIQYFASPLISFLSGSWMSYMFRDISSPNAAVTFACVSIIGVTLGYKASIRLGSKESINVHSDLKKNVYLLINKYLKIEFLILIVLAVWIFFLLFHYSLFGDLSNVFYSSEVRGFGQFTDQGISVDIGYFFNNISSALAIIGSVLLGFFCGLKEKNNGLALVMSMLILVLLSAPFFFKYSRMSGICFIVFSIFYLMPNGKRVYRLIPFFCVIIFSFYLNMIGFTHRGDNGYFNFLVDFFNPNLTIISLYLNGFDGYKDYAALNFLDSVAPFAAHTYYSISDVGFFASMQQFLLAIQPLPSRLFSGVVVIGASLSNEFGTVGSTGITTPAFSELNYLFGYFSFILFFIYGIFLRLVDLKLATRPGVASVMIFVLVLAGIFVAGHSGLRSFARPTLLAFVFMYILFPKGKELVIKLR